MNSNTMIAIVISAFFIFLMILSVMERQPNISDSESKTQIEAVARGYAKFKTSGKTVQFVWNEIEDKNPEDN